MKLPVIKESKVRSPAIRMCPFGLDIAISCKNAGDSVLNMQPLLGVEKDKRRRVQRANRRVYRHHKTGERCPYADKIVEDKDIVHCDYGDNGEGIRDTPMRPSPYYPRVFSGLGQVGLYAYPVNYYIDHGDTQLLFDGVYNIYAQTGEIDFLKTSQYEPENFEYHEIQELFTNLEE